MNRPVVHVSVLIMGMSNVTLTVTVTVTVAVKVTDYLTSEFLATIDYMRALERIGHYLCVIH